MSESFEELRLRLSETLILSYFVTFTSEDICCRIQNVKFNMPCEDLFVMFVTAVCFLFLLIFVVVVVVVVVV